MTFETSKSPQAFSLVEVVLSLGIFSVLILTVIAMLSPTLRTLRETEEAAAVERIPTLLHAELTSLNGFPLWSPEGPDRPVYVDQESRALFTAESAGDDLRNRFYRVELRPANDHPYRPGDPYRLFEAHLYWPAVQLTGPSGEGILRDQDASDRARLRQRVFFVSLRR